MLEGGGPALEVEVLREGEDEALVQAALVEVVGCFEGLRVRGQDWRPGEHDAGFDCEVR